jgi:hypothetical protein
VAFNIFFFRPGPGLTVENIEAQYPGLKVFCRTHVNDIINKINPTNILAFPFTTFEALKGGQEVASFDHDGVRLLREARLDPVIFPNFNGSLYGANWGRVSNRDWDRLCRELRRRLGELTAHSSSFVFNAITTTRRPGTSQSCA